MKDIKELIYAAVEENAVAFQELAGGILQARAYDAIEALRPEVGASMFGESSHMKSKDDEDEEMEDEEDEDEDEDEVKESVREYLNQQGTGKSAEGYDDAGTFDRQTAEKHAAKHGGKVVPDPSGKHLVKLPGKKKMQEALHPNQQKIDVVDDEKIDAKDFAKLRAMKKNEEVDEAVNVYMKDPAPEGEHIGTPIRYAKGHSAHGDQHRAMAAKAAKAARQQGHLRGNDNSHTGWKGSERITKERTGGVFAGRGPKPSNEEVEQINEVGDTEKGKAALTNLASQRFGRARWAGGVHRALAGSERHATTTSPHSRLQDKDAAVAHKAAAKVGIKPHEVPDHNYDYDKKGGYGTKVADPAHKFAARNSSTRFEEVEQIDEVDHPKNQADMLAHILHQVKTTGHPVATDAQFRATTVGKDTTKKASLEPGQDKLQYAVAQGGNVKP